MAVTVETLEKLERKITLSLPLAAVQSEVESRLKRWRAPSRWTASVPARCP
jgi:trigger factor